MTRAVCVLARRPAYASALERKPDDIGLDPSGPDDLPAEFYPAMVEDVYAMACDLQHVMPALALIPADQPDIAALTGPTDWLVRQPRADGRFGISSAPADAAAADADELFILLLALSGPLDDTDHEPEDDDLGIEPPDPGGSTAEAAIAVVAGDAPDLPGLLVGKLFRALGSAEVAVCPAAGGGLVAVASRVPVPDWFVRARVGLDTTDAVDRLQAAAPHPRSLGVAPGWHRVRVRADLDRLDPGLDGWDATRTLLGR